MFWHEGIGFRPTEKRDLENVRKLRNEPSTWLYLTDVTLISPEMQERWFENMSKSKDKMHFSVFKEKKGLSVSCEGDFLGIIRMDQIDQNNRSIRIGCDIVPNERNRGYGTKAFNAILKFFFDHKGMHRLWLYVLENNEVAKKLYAKIGLKEEGRFRQAIWRDGKWFDCIVMSILEDEYRNE